LETYLAYLNGLETVLLSHYTPPNTLVGYDYNHIFEMLVLGPRIKAFRLYEDLDLKEFSVAVWLHNTDRPTSLKDLIGFTKGMPEKDFKEVWGEYLRKLLEDSPFTEEVRNKIVGAVLEHPKKNDGPDDSVLLTALRIADKVVRFGPLGMMGQPSNNRGNVFYDLRKPFDYESTVEGRLKSVYNDYMRVLEWYAMLPSDEARSLIRPRWMEAQLLYLRVLGEQIAEYTGFPNGIESDIKKALGSFYEQFRQ
jgi:hypothetical protein